jgi:cation transport ATPase
VAERDGPETLRYARQARATRVPPACKRASLTLRRDTTAPRTARPRLGTTIITGENQMTDRTIVTEDQSGPSGRGGLVGRETATREVHQETNIVAPRDRVRWGPIFAGLLTALGTFLLLSTAALAIGVLAAPRGTDVNEAGSTAGIVSAVIALLAFFLGGFVAARTAAVTGRGNGGLNGFLVWALGILLILALAAFGLGQLFGAAGDLFGQYRSLGSPSPDVNQGEVADAVRTGAVSAFLGLALPALAATLGGVLGAREGRDFDGRTAH